MKVGLVGYAGSGKSTVFQWLTGATPDPSKIQQGQSAVADVPDDRLRPIADVYKPKKFTLAKVEFLDTRFQEQLQQRSNARLEGLWALDEDERLEYATVVVPRPRAAGCGGPEKGAYFHAPSACRTETICPRW